MHIIGGHDYYDCMLAYGRDMDIVFVRDGRKVRAKRSSDDFDWLRSSHDQVHLRFHNSPVKQPWRTDWIDVGPTHKIRYKLITVIVADTLYRGMRICVSSEKMPSLHPDLPFQYVWSDEQLDKLIPGLTAYESGGMFASPKEQRPRWFTAKKLSREQIDTMINHQIAVVVEDTGNDDIIINGDNLKNIAFFKVLDPLQCYTVLYDWISGVLSTNANKMVQIQDPKILLKKHGMDETSFRNPKRKKT